MIEAKKLEKIARTLDNNLTKNVIQLRKGFVNLPEGKGNSIYMTVVAELMQFGFLLETSAIEVLSKASESDVIEFHDETVTYLKRITGSNRNYTPFWKNFPEEVMEKTEAELWLHQIVHYISNGKYEPNTFHC